MTLHAIVAALGGDLYSAGSRASIPAPGHSERDRSVSLWLTEGRVVIHGFGGADWRAARDHLRDRGFIDDAGRLTGGGCGRSSTPRPDDAFASKRRPCSGPGLWASPRAIRPTSISEGAPSGLEAGRSISAVIPARRFPSIGEAIEPGLRLSPGSPTRMTV